MYTCIFAIYVMHTMKSSQMIHATCLARCNLAVSSACRRPGRGSDFGACSRHSMSWSLPTSFVPLSHLHSLWSCEVSHRVADCSPSTAMMFLGDGVSRWSALPAVGAGAVPELSTIASSTTASSVTRRRRCLCNTLTSMTVCGGAEGTQSAQSAGELMRTAGGAVPTGACHVRLAAAALWRTDCAISCRPAGCALTSTDSPA